MARNELLVCGDDRFACKERGAHPLGGRLDAADRLDDDVDVARQDVVDAIGPDDSARVPGRKPVALLVSAAIENVGEIETMNCVGNEPPSDGRSDRAQSKQTHPTARSGWKDGGGFVELGARTVTGCVKRIDGHVSFLISPPSSTFDVVSGFSRTRRQELAPNRGPCARVVAVASSGLSLSHSG